MSDFFSTFDFVLTFLVLDKKVKMLLMIGMKLEKYKNLLVFNCGLPLFGRIRVKS